MFGNFKGRFQYLEGFYWFILNEYNFDTSYLVPRFAYDPYLLIYMVYAFTVMLVTYQKHPKVPNSNYF